MGLVQSLGTGAAWVDGFCSTALGDDAQAVIFEGFEAVRPALYQLHFPVEALGDAVVAGEAPHAGDLLGPVAKGLGEGESGLEAALAEALDVGDELLDVATAGSLGLVLESKEPRQALLHLIDALERRMLGEEGLQALPLLGFEAVGAATKKSEPAAVPAERRHEMPCQAHQV